MKDTVSTEESQIDIRVSIIVPVYNSEHLVDVFFEPFLLNSECFYELIVVDNGSTDATYALIKEYMNKVRGLKLFKYNQKQSSYAARNYGVSKSIGELIAFIDFDCVVTQSYFSGLLNLSVQNKKSEFYAGSVEIYNVNHSIYQLFDQSSNLRQEMRARRGSVLTANVVTFRDHFHSVGGFLEVKSGGDHDFSQRSIMHGLSLVYIDGMKVLHPPRLSFSEHKEKARRVGIGLTQVNLKANPGFINLSIFVFKKVSTLFFPLHQLKTAFKIANSEPLSSRQIIELFGLAYSVGFISRIYSLKSVLNRKAL